jgi:rare lipoprotein A
LEVDGLKVLSIGTALLSFAILPTLVAANNAEAAIWTGTASYYNLRSKTASGGRVGPMTAAHRTLPFGSKLLITNLGNNRSAVVTVNDRGPFIRSRIVDVSEGAANALGFRHAGVARVRVEVVSR